MVEKGFFIKKYFCVGSMLKGRLILRTIYSGFEMRKHQFIQIVFLNLLCLLLISSNVTAQNYFQKTFGDSTITEQGQLVYQTSDGIIYYFGSGFEGGNNDAEITMHKLNLNGDILSKTIFPNNNGDEYAFSMIYNNGVFVIVGEQQVTGSNDIDGLIIMIDTLGQVLSSQLIGVPTKTESLHGITKTSDGGYIVCGFISGRNGLGNDFLTIKFNSDLSIAWSKAEGTAVNEVGMKSIELSNGNIISTGDQQQTAGNYNVYCQIFDANGNFLYDKTIVEPYNGGSKTAMLDSNNDVLILGEMNNTASIEFDAYLIKLDENTNTIWTKFLTNHPGSDAGFGIIEPNIGDYVVCGYGTNPATNNQDLMLLSTDTSGNVIERKYYGSSSPDIGYTVCPSVNGGFLLSGFVHVGSDAQYFLVYDELQVAVSTNEEKRDFENFTVFPNPLKQQTLYFSKPLEDVNLSIFNQNGQLIENRLLRQATTEYSVMTTLSSGIYFIHFEFENYTKTVQIVVP